MAQSALHRYLDAEILRFMADRHFEPQRLVEGHLAGSHQSPMSGFAVEFASHREYVPGDDPKHIDWRIYFTRDKYFIKQYEMETNLVCHLVVDTSASMRYGEGQSQKLHCAAQLATVLGYSVVRQSDKVSLATFDTQLRGFLEPSDSMAQVARLASHLEESSAAEKTLIGPCLNELAEQFGRREMVVLLSDFFVDLKDLESAVQRLRFDHHEVVLMHVLHHDEVTFPLEGMTRLVGLELSDEMQVQPEDLRPGYLAALQRFQQQLQQLCAENHCEYLLVDTSCNLGELLADYLTQRSQLPPAS